MSVYETNATQACKELVEAGEALSIESLAKVSNPPTVTMRPNYLLDGAGRRLLEACRIERMWARFNAGSDPGTLRHRYDNHVLALAAAQKCAAEYGNLYAAARSCEQSHLDGLARCRATYEDPAQN